MLRNSITKKEDETKDEEQHNDHDEPDKEEDDQLDDWYLVREFGGKLGNPYS